MTSPYLNRPLRSLNDVLKQRGMTLSDIDSQVAANDTYPIDSAAEKRSFGYVNALLVTLILAGIFAVGLYLAQTSSSDVTVVTEIPAESLNDIAERLNDGIATAAGGDQK